MSDVLRDLSDLGYAAQWDLLPALANGASHLRHRVWIVAYPEERALGRVFDGPPFVFPFPPDPAEREDEWRIPRLTRSVPHRRERLTALGNAVVPQAVASVMIYTLRALSLEPLVAPGLFAGEWPEGRFPKAGALLGGSVYAMPSTDTGKTPPRFWPTPAARETSWSVEALARCVDKNGEPARDPHARFYHPETGQIVQRTLDSYVKGAEAGLWPTPSASDGLGGRVSSEEVRATGRRPSGAKAQRTLGDAAVDAESGPWPTPSASDWKGSSALGQRRRQLEERVKTVEKVWPTATASDASKGSPGQTNGEGGPGLTRAVNDAEALWPTPKDSPSGPDFARAGRERSGGDDLATSVARREETTEQGRSLNPPWVEWLMGYPIGWTDPEA